jgi:hypothetical protein
MGIVVGPLYLVRTSLNIEEDLSKKTHFAQWNMVVNGLSYFVGYLAASPTKLRNMKIHIYTFGMVR